MKSKGKAENSLGEMKTKHNIPWDAFIAVNTYNKRKAPK